MINYAKIDIEYLNQTKGLTDVAKLINNVSHQPG